MQSRERGRVGSIEQQYDDEEEFSGKLPFGGAEMELNPLSLMSSWLRSL